MKMLFLSGNEIDNKGSRIVSCNGNVALVVEKFNYFSLYQGDKPVTFQYAGFPHCFDDSLVIPENFREAEGIIAYLPFLQFDISPSNWDKSLPTRVDASVLFGAVLENLTGVSIKGLVCHCVSEWYAKRIQEGIYMGSAGKRIIPLRYCECGGRDTMKSLLHSFLTEGPKALYQQYLSCPAQIR